jgi:hypothetical protein
MMQKALPIVSSYSYPKDTINIGYQVKVMGPSKLKKEIQDIHQKALQKNIEK